jgi:protein-ribulosamine 3-kinase
VNPGWRAVVQAIASAAGERPAAGPARTEHGAFDDRHHWPSAAGALFVKTAPASAAARFAAEAQGLRALAATGALRVPRVIGHGLAAGTAWLALEWLELGAPDARSDAALGQALAALHRHAADRFGFEHDNFVGATPQANGWLEDGSRFLIERRLGPQLALAREHGHARLAARGDELLAAVPALLEGHRPRPSLLHGDLWAGNRARLGDGTPVVFDPAAYYGDREAELAMTRLFGGFDAAFYRAYEAVFPLLPGAARREGLHTLYHVLNHANLFGGGYVGEAEALLARLIESAR